MPTNSPNMNLPIPVVGLDPAPTWATLLDQCLTIIDGHNHTNGSGVPIVPGAININADLTFNSNNATNLRTTRFTAQGSPIPATGADLNQTYVSGVDLYYNDGNGNQVRITQSGGVAGSPGSISNLTSPASAAYVAANGKFVWQQAANTSADMDFGSAIMRNDTANSFALTLQPPTLGANYSITLPALPASQKIMTLDSSGNMSAPYTVDGSTIAISSNVIGVPNGGIGKSQLAALGQQISSSSGAFSTSNTTFTTVTNLSVTITTTGRPVFVGLVADGSSNNSNVLVGAASTGFNYRFRDTLGSTNIAQGSLGNSTGANLWWPISSFSHFYVPSAGTYNYIFQVESLSVGVGISVNYAKLVAYELD